MGIIWSGLAPHPPIIVEAVGGSRCGEVQTTIDAMAVLSQDLLAAKPDRLVIVSPHSPRPRTGIGLWTKPTLVGSLARFGAPARVSVPLDAAWCDQFARTYAHTTDLGDEPLDHGVMVPLHFVAAAGWSGPTVVLGLPFGEDEVLDPIGDAIALCCADSQRTALLASGDMSHCLIPDAPAGFDPRGARFDNAFVTHIQVGQYREAQDLDPTLRYEAKQDVVESCRVVWRATDYASDRRRFLSYEGPFGVGYTVMKFFGSD